MPLDEKTANKMIFLKDIITPNFLYFTIEQQVLNVVRTGLFYNEKDILEWINEASLNAFLSAIYKLSMYALYKDFIHRQSGILMDIENKLKYLEKSVKKNDKNYE